MNNKTSNIYPWVVVGLLWGVALLNYMDRQMLSTMRIPASGCPDDFLPCFHSPFRLPIFQYTHIPHFCL